MVEEVSGGDERRIGNVCRSCLPEIVTAHAVGLMVERFARKSALAITVYLRVSFQERPVCLVDINNDKPLQQSIQAVYLLLFPIVLHSNG